MPGYLSPIDIANRGLQHCGAERIDATQGFEEDSKRASECAFVYDKLRRAELRRNLWAFAIRNAVIRPVDRTFRLLAPTLWSGNVTYPAGALCSDVTGSIWISTVVSNINRPPGYSQGWELYFGPMAIPAYDADTTYWAGDVVYIAEGDGTYAVYYSLENGNDADPETPEAWSATTTYRKGDLAAVSTTPYVSLIDLNTNQNPTTTAAAAYAEATAYVLNDRVLGTDGYVYTAKGATTGNDPVYDFLATYWTKGSLAAWSTTTGTRGTGSTKWQPLDAMLQDLVILSPMVLGPDRQPKSIYRLPANYLRLAPQNPKAGSMSPLGAPSGERYRDWNIQGQYLSTMETDPILLRFGADYTDVATMDDMFCEGLAARIGYEVCEPLNQDKGKKQIIASEYNKFMGEARTVNGIETGPTEPPEDDWVTCRL
jgi:hypothetical protein